MAIFLSKLLFFPFVDQVLGLINNRRGFQITKLTIKKPKGVYSRCDIKNQIAVILNESGYRGCNMMHFGTE